MWRDADGDGKSDKGELFTLNELGISAVDLERGDLRALDIEADANQILATARAFRSDGTSMLVGDVALLADLKAGNDCGCSAMNGPVSVNDLHPSFVEVV